MGLVIGGEGLDNGIMASVGEKEKTCWVRREEDWEREDSR